MLARSYLVFFLSLFASTSFANDANWNCQQDKNTKEWVCVGSSANAGKASTSVPDSQEKLGIIKQDSVSKPAETDSVGVMPIEENGSGISETPENTQPLNAKSNLVAEPAEIPVKESGLEKSPTTVSKSISDRPVSAPTTLEAPPPVLSAAQKPLPAVNKPSAIADTRQQRGWNCNTKGADGNWNCQLVGTDPKGEARVVESEEERFSLLTPAFDNKEEHVFNTLRDRFKTNPWGNCTIQLGTQKYYVPENNQRDTANIDMNSNAAEIYDNEIGNYQGNVEMKRADQQASANSANYDAVSESLDLHGNVFYSEDELSLYTESATLKLASDEARLRDALFISPTTPIRGRANAVYRDSKSLSRYKDVAYTSCAPGNQDWVVHASDLKMNKKSGYGSAKNAWVEFKGVPAFYSPYLSFPLDDRRLTGFLAPSFGNTQKGGFSFSTPFYWNIAPNYDATLRPRYLTKRGVLLAGDFRYLTEKSKGLVSAEYMPDDSTVEPDDGIRNSSRYLATIKNFTQFTPKITSNLDLNVVSDKFYFAELGNALSFPNFSHIKSYADASYIDQGISLVGRLESYQTIDPNLTGRLRPYRRLPQLNLKLDHAFEAIPANTALESEYVYFQHDNSSIPAESVPNGHRFNIKPSVSFPLQTASAYVTPKLSLQHTQYLLDNQEPGLADSISRTLPVTSIDSGVFFEKDLDIAGNSFLHTIEPRLFYLFIPKVNQNEIPIFDTSLYDFQFDSLFRENRYNGLDRIQDANQLSAAVTSRLVDPKTGLEKLKISVGDIFYFQDREVNAPVVRIGRSFLNSRVETSSFSPLVADLSSQINEHLSLDTGMQWDTERNEIVRGKATLHIVNDPGEIFNIGYLYRKNALIEDTLNSKSDIELENELGISNVAVQNLRKNNTVLRSNDIIQSDVSFRWPIYDDWFAVGRWQYSLLYNQTQEALFGFEKENCCWRFRVVGRRYVNNINAAANAVEINGNPSSSQTGIFFQIELKGLTGIGNAGDIGDFFTKSIYGYHKTDY
jgi:LPS-assembly protein